MLKIALLILTLGDGGAVRVTLTEAESLADCEATHDVLTQILTEAGNPPIVAVCGETVLRLTPFVHGTSPDAETHLYRVDLPSAGGYHIQPLAEGEICTPHAAADPAIYCARSGQSVASDD